MQVGLICSGDEQFMDILEVAQCKLTVCDLDGARANDLENKKG